MSNAQVSLPDIILKDIDGNEVSLATLSKDKTIVVSLWATWCVPCIKELDAIHAQYDKLKKESSFELIALNVDDSRSLRRVEPTVKGKKWKYTVLMDSKNQVRNHLGITSIPYTMIIKDGKIKYRSSTYKPGDEELLIKKFNEISRK
jgi:peroxiredoxin